MVSRFNRNGLVWWQSIMAGLTFVSASLVQSDVLPEKASGVFLMVVGGLQAATAAFVAGTRPLPELVATPGVDVKTGRDRA